MYHDIYKTPRETKYDHFYVLESVFAQQLDALLGAGYKPIALKEAIAQSQNPSVNATKSFVVTFDDGYESFANFAASVLDDRKIPSTVFLVSNMIGTHNHWVEKEGFRPDSLMTWAQIEYLKYHHPRVDFQSHTANHVRLADIPLVEAVTELTESKARLEQKLGSPIDTICYPWGSVNDAVVNAASDAGYKYGVTTEFGRMRPNENPMLLPRIAMHHVPWFSLKFGPRWPNFWWRIKTRKDGRS
jgi:peptidoglycan/xylan/chitin deacetylase (PgdA/CDA1 family)